jgi:serine/threonine-protein kinase RIO1
MNLIRRVLKAILLRQVCQSVTSNVLAVENEEGRRSVQKGAKAQRITKRRCTESVDGDERFRTRGVNLTRSGGESY